MIGYIQLHRKLLEWEWYHDVNTFKLFIHILLKANFEPKKWQGIEIKRGQLVTSIKHLSIETGLTEKQVRNSIDKLILTKEVGKQTTSQNTTLTILSYDLYQQEGKPKGKQRANEGQTKGERRANEGQQLNNDNKEENEENEDNLFKNKDLQKIFLEFSEMRKKIKKPMTEKAEQLFKSKLEDLSNKNISLAIQIVNQSILNCWQDIYPLKTDFKPKFEPKEDRKDVEAFLKRHLGTQQENNILQIETPITPHQEI